MATSIWQSLPQTSLGFWPTPLQPLQRLTRELGGPTIWIKRDDCTGLAVGGNKTRKLEFLIGAALAEAADTVVTFGAVQSNHARQTAAACAQAGLTCHQVLSRTVTRLNPAYDSGGNVLLDRLLGAQQHFVEPHEAGEDSRQLIADLEKAGHTVYVIPAGGSNALGALGYAQCALELAEQCETLNIRPKHIIHASSSAGTQAGLLYGLNALGLSIDVLGINVYHNDPHVLEKRVSQLYTTMCEQYGTPSHHNPPLKVNVNHAYFGEGYGQPTPECLDAIHMAAELEGLLFDPVYSGKALAALIDQITLGNFAEHDHVVLIHTGGSPALYVYDDALFPRSR